MIEKIKNEIQRRLNMAKDRVRHVNALGMTNTCDSQLIIHLEALLQFIHNIEKSVNKDFK